MNILFARCLLQALLVCFSPRDMMRNPVPTSYRDFHGYGEEEATEWRHFDTSSQLCFLEWLHFVYMKMVEHILLYLFLPYLMFFIIDNQRVILSYQIRQLPCRARGVRAHKPIFAPTIPHGQFCRRKHFFFPLIDRLVCTIQSSQILDAIGINMLHTIIIVI